MSTESTAPVAYLEPPEWPEALTATEYRVAVYRARRLSLRQAQALAGTVAALTVAAPVAMALVGSRP